jgi:hypothetical protein
MVGVTRKVLGNNGDMAAKTLLGQDKSNVQADDAGAVFRQSCLLSCEGACFSSPDDDDLTACG